MREDPDLLERAQSHSPEALGELYDNYAPQVYAYAYRRVSDPKVAEDLTGEVFVRVVMALHAGQTWHTSFRSWLFRVAHNLIIDHYRRRPPEPFFALEEIETAAVERSPADRVQEALDHERLRHALRCLTPEQQEVLALRYGEGLTARQTARVVNKTVGAVEALQHRALAALRRILTGEKRKECASGSQAASMRATVDVRKAVTKA